MKTPICFYSSILTPIGYNKDERRAQFLLLDFDDVRDDNSTLLTVMLKTDFILMHKNIRPKPDIYARIPKFSYGVLEAIEDIKLDDNGIPINKRGMPVLVELEVLGYHNYLALDPKHLLDWNETDVDEYSFNPDSEEAKDYVL